MRTAYKAYTIVTDATQRDTGGWMARATVFNGTDGAVMESLELGGDTLATEDLAHQAALLLGRAWVDHLR